MIVADTEDFEIHYREGAPGLLWVPFAPLNLFADGKTFWGERVAVNGNLSALAVMPKKPHWYPPASLSEALKDIRHIIGQYDEVVTFGASMGAYGALKNSKVIGATTAIAFAPQATINPDEIEDHLNPHKKYFRHDIHAEMRIAAADVIDKAFVIYDNFEPVDLRNANLITERIPSIHTVKVPMAGHELLRIYAGSERTKMVIEAAKQGDAARLASLGASFKRSSPVRARIVLQRYTKKNPALAEKLFEPIKEQVAAREAASFYAHLEKAFTVRRDVDAANSARAQKDHYWSRI